MKLAFNAVLCSLALLGSASAFAATEGSGDVSTLRYFTPEGKIFVEPALTYGKSTSHFNNNISNVKTMDAKGTSWTASLGAQYGIMKNFLAGVSMDYEIMNTVKNSVQPAGTDAGSFKSKGFSDPTVNAEYRYMDSNWTGDAFLLVKPSIFEPKNASIGDSSIVGKNSTLTGGHDITLGTQLITKMGSGEFDVAPAVTYSTAGKYRLETRSLTTGAVTKTNGEIESEINFTANVDYRHHFSNCYAQLGVGVQAPHTQKIQGLSTDVNANGSSTVTQQTGTTIETEVSMVYSPKVVLGYKIGSNTDLSLTGAYTMYDTTTKTKNQAGTASSVTSADVSLWNFSVALAHQI